MAYQKKYEKPYPEWHNKPVMETPITEEVMEGIDAALASIEDQLEKTTAIYEDGSRPKITFGNTDKTLLTDYSVVAGAGNAVRGIYSMACGSSNEVSATSSIVAGSQNAGIFNSSEVIGTGNTVSKGGNTKNSRISGSQNTIGFGDDIDVSGSKNEIYGNQNRVGGSENKILGGSCNDVTGSNNEIVSGGFPLNISIAGLGNKNINTSSRYPQRIIGKYNDYLEHADNFADILLEVGNGESDTKRSNAMYLDGKGNMRIAGDLIFGADKVKVSSIKGIVFDTTSAAIRDIGLIKEGAAYHVGQTIRIKEIGRSDLWISGVHAERVDYSSSYDLEENILRNGGSVRIGNYSVSMTDSRTIVKGSLYSAIEFINAATGLFKGQEIKITEPDVPDLWIGGKTSTSEEYTYVSDEEFLSRFDGNASGSVTVGSYYVYLSESRTKTGFGSFSGNYNELDNKPSINGVELREDKSFEELGMTPLTNTEILNIINKVNARRI